jgi:hypothetical protein
MRMTVLSLLVGAAAEEGGRLPLISGVYPIIALVGFAVLAGVAWAYRDVAHRHADKTGDLGPHGPAQH